MKCLECKKEMDITDIFHIEDNVFKIEYFCFDCKIQKDIISIDIEIIEERGA